LWDLNRLRYIRSLSLAHLVQKHFEIIGQDLEINSDSNPLLFQSLAVQVDQLAISSISGELVTSARISPHSTNDTSDSAGGTSILAVWTINGELISSVYCSETITCVLITCGPMG